MKIPRLQAALLPLYGVILRCCASFLPLAQRQEWLNEWMSELWYVRRSAFRAGTGALSAHLAVASFCRGAVADLWELKMQQSSRGLSLCNPTHCLLLLIVFACVSFGIAYSIPNVRAAFLPVPYREAGNISLIFPGGTSEASVAKVRAAQYLDLRKKTERFFTDLAFYEIVSKRVHVSRHRLVELSVARSSLNLFSLLGVQPSSSSLLSESDLPQRNDLPRAILSEKTWKTYFHSDPQIRGQILNLGGKEVWVEGVLATDDWRLPGHPDLWLMEGDNELAASSAHSKGFLLGHLRPALTFKNADQSNDKWYMKIPRPDDEVDSYDCVSLNNRGRQPWVQFLFALFLASLALPATTSLPLGEYPHTSHRLTAGIRVRRWLFLLFKLAASILFACFVGMSIAYASEQLAPSTAAFVQMTVTFLVCLITFRWTLKDQRRRCPVCLEVLQNPARVGEPSRNFLSWNGIELICVGGHGFLHVPELPTSWFGTQRWLYLDPSWKSLFDQRPIEAAYP